MLPTAEIDPKIPRRFPDRVENLMLNLRTVSDELFSDSLVRNLRATDMNEYGEGRFAWADPGAAPVYRFKYLPGNIPRLVEQQRKLYREPEEPDRPLRS